MEVEKKTSESGTSPFSTAIVPYQNPEPQAPSFNEPQNMSIQTTPQLTGIQITQELKNVVNQLHQSHPGSKIHMSTFRSAISKKLRELGVDSSHTSAYITKMRKFYDELYAASNGGDPAGGVL